MKRYPVKRVKSAFGGYQKGWYEYRGTQFSRDDSYPPRQYGRYRIFAGPKFGTQKQVLDHIDSLLVNVLSEE